MIVLKNQFKIQMLHSDWSNSNFWINTLYFMCMLAMLKKILMILWSSQIQKMFLHISILSWSRAHLKMGLFSFPCVKISSLILSFSFNYPLFLQKYYNFSKRKMETIVIWLNMQIQKRTKSTEQRQIIYNYLWFHQYVNIKKNPRVSENFLSILIN